MFCPVFICSMYLPREGTFCTALSASTFNNIYTLLVKRIKRNTRRQY